MDIEFNFNNILNSTKQSFDLSDSMIFKLYHSAVEVAGEVISEIQTGIDNSDFEKIKDAAHKLRGASGSIKLDAIYELSTDIEKDAKEHKNRDYKSDIETIEKYFNSLEKSIKNV